MALKAVIAKLEDVPEGVRALYKAADGKFVLDVDGMVPEDEVGALKTKVEEFRDNNIALNRRLEKFKNVDPEKYAQLESDVVELRKKAEKAGTQPADLEAQIAAAIVKATDPLDKKLKAIEAERDDAKKALATKELHDKLWQVGVAAGVREEAKDFWLSKAAPMFKLQGEHLIAYKVDAEGHESAIYSKDKVSEPLTAKEWALKIAPADPSLALLYKGSSGSGGRNDKGAQIQDGKRIIPNDATLVSQNLEGIANGTVQIMR